MYNSGKFNNPIGIVPAGLGTLFQMINSDTVLNQEFPNLISVAEGYRTEFSNSGVTSDRYGLPNDRYIELNQLTLILSGVFAEALNGNDTSAQRLEQIATNDPTQFDSELMDIGNAYKSTACRM